MSAPTTGPASGLRIAARVEAACAVVGTTSHDVLAALGPYDGDAYLVGSLAAGLGDVHSDIDVFVVGDDDRARTGPALAFTPAGVCIDVRYLRRGTLDRVLADRGRANAGPRPGRSDAWLLSRWSNAVPFHDGAPPLLDDHQRALARKLLVDRLVADVTALAAFAELGARAGARRSWYLCRRAGTAAWELAATLAGQDHLGERWLPARSSHPAVAAIATMAGAVQRPEEVGQVLDALGIDPADLPRRVRLQDNPEAERWTLAGARLLLVGGRRLVPRVDPVPTSVAAALRLDPASTFEGLVDGALRWTVDVDGIVPTLEAGR